MRAYPHHPDEQLALEELEDLKSIFQYVGATLPPGTEPGPDPFWIENAECGLSLARYSYAFEAPAPEVRHYLSHSNASFSVGLEQGTPFHLGKLMQQIASAVVVNDGRLASQLCALAPARYQVAGVTHEPVVYREFDVWTALVLERFDAAEAKLAVAEASLHSDKLSRLAVDDRGSMLALLRQVLVGDPTGLDAALESRAIAFAKIHKGPTGRDRPDGLLDLRGLALAAMGRRRGLAPSIDNVYLPLSIIAD